jgi:carotenoid cleavage dioxygenase-like enzyme
MNKQEFNIPDHLMIHDWAFTDTHYIVFANRIKLDVAGNEIHINSDARKTHLLHYCGSLISLFLFI